MVLVLLNELSLFHLQIFSFLCRPGCIFFSNEQYKPTFKRRRQNIKKVSELNNFFTVNGKLKNFVPMH